MFIVYLKFSANRSRAGEFMDGHNAWLKAGFDDGVFVLAGSSSNGSAKIRLWRRTWSARKSTKSRRQKPMADWTSCSSEVSGTGPGHAKPVVSA